MEQLERALNDVSKEHAATNELLEKRRQEREQIAKELKGEIDRLHARQLRLRLVLQRRITELTTENEMWRKCFVAVYTKLLSSSAGAERAMTLILQKLGMRLGGRKIRDIPEEDFIEFLFDEKIVEKWQALP